MQNKEGNEGMDHKEDKYLYFVDGDRFEVDHKHITGAMIKVKLPEAKRGYALYLEGDEKDPDKLINDDTTITLEKEEPKNFYTVPPASFGKA